MHNEYSAGIVIYCIEDKKPVYLLLQYSAGYWDFPKGHIEDKETKQETALRELFEETGITTTIDPDFEETFSYFFSKPDGTHIKKTVYFFMAKTPDKTVDLSYEHIGYVWLPYREAHEKVTYENAKQLLANVNTNVRNFRIGSRV